MTLSAIQCSACGGTVAMLAGEDMPTCVFCGSDALQEDETEEIEQPEDWISFEVKESGAKSTFKRFAESSWFHPSGLRQAVVNLKPILVPAWVYSGIIESHWAALVSALSTSGKRPETGVEKLSLRDVLILSGSQLTQAELNALAPFELRDKKGPGAEKPKFPFEVSRLTRSLARAQAKSHMRALHAKSIGAAIHPKELKLSSVFHNVAGEPILLPVFICSYRYKETAYRLVINGQTGEWYGKGPKSLVKVLLVAGLALAAIMAILFFVGALL
jgi:hypothetical protein